MTPTVPPCNLLLPLLPQVLPSTPKTCCDAEGKIRKGGRCARWVTGSGSELLGAVRPISVRSHAAAAHLGCRSSIAPLTKQLSSCIAGHMRVCGTLICRVILGSLRVRTAPS
jgi:hypothetical protein